MPGEEHHVARLGLQVLAAVDEQRGAGDRRRFDQEAHGARDVAGLRRARERRQGMRAANSSAVIGPDSSVTPGATPQTRTLGASACASSVVAASSAAFDKVYER